MGTRELKIHIPEGQEIDWQESAKQEKVIFKPINDKPRSWEEYVQNPGAKPYSSYALAWGTLDGFANFKDIKWHCSVPTPSLATAFIAMMKLMSLRQAWIGDWELDWNGGTFHSCIVLLDNKYIVNDFSRYHRALSFPTREMAEEFMNTFKDLLEIAKPLI